MKTSGLGEIGRGVWARATGLLGLTWFLASPLAGANIPKLLDERLTLTLFAQDPEIRTPIGLAIDSHDRVYVLESHTHTPPEDYQGPATDRVVAFADDDGDGVPEKRWVYADGIEAGMNLAFAPDGELYVCAAREVLAFKDADGDGQSDGRRLILRVETDNKYPHSCQMGIAISPDGWIYVSRGNNGSQDYAVHGTDGRTLRGFGDGGNVYRCRLDGSRLEEVATGFWNSMDLKFDSHGRLMLVDNDPDARGPNRLVHVVERGDYGYKSMYGGGGNHPYQGWDGTLPGTLPFAAGTGEAPSGLIDTDRTSFPSDYEDQYLVTIWNENSIARFRPRNKGVSLEAESEIWMQGGQNFRPVALEADSRGNLYITDWMLVAYPNHGRGSIWRVSVREDDHRSKPLGYFDRPHTDPGAETFAGLITAKEASDFPRLKNALKSGDAFVRHAAVVALSRPVFLGALEQSAQDEDARVRLGVLLAMRGHQAPQVKEALLRAWLSDPEPQVRRAALMAIGEESITALRPDLQLALRGDQVTPDVLEMYLATEETLEPEFVEGKRRGRGRANRVARRLDSAIVEGLMRDESRSDRLRALVLAHLQEADEPRNREYLMELTRQGSPILQREAIRSLSLLSQEPPESLFLSLAEDEGLQPQVRAEALLALSRAGWEDAQRLLPLLDDDSVFVRWETLRTLRVHAWKPEIRKALQKRFEDWMGDHSLAELLEQIEYALHPPGTEADRRYPRPQSIEGWEKRLADGGQPERGALVFFSAQTQCAQCHQIEHRGRRIGPELSNVGQSLSRQQIIRSILRPSDQFPPQYQAWFVELKDGDLHQGLQLDHKSRGAIELYTTEGRTRHFEGDTISRYGHLPNSLMPDGMEQTMTVEEMRDLVAYLESLR